MSFSMTVDVQKVVQSQLVGLWWWNNYGQTLTSINYDNIDLYHDIIYYYPELP